MNRSSICPPHAFRGVAREGFHLLVSKFLRSSSPDTLWQFFSTLSANLAELSPREIDYFYCGGVVAKHIFWNTNWVERMNWSKWINWIKWILTHALGARMT